MKKCLRAVYWPRKFWRLVLGRDWGQSEIRSERSAVGNIQLSISRVFSFFVLELSDRRFFSLFDTFFTLYHMIFYRVDQFDDSNLSFTFYSMPLVQLDCNHRSSIVDYGCMYSHSRVTPRTQCFVLSSLFSFDCTVVFRNWKLSGQIYFSLWDHLVGTVSNLTLHFAQEAWNFSHSLNFFWGFSHQSKEHVFIGQTQEWRLCFMSCRLAPSLEGENSEFL